MTFFFRRNVAPTFNRLSYGLHRRFQTLRTFVRSLIQLSHTKIWLAVQVGWVREALSHGTTSTSVCSFRLSVISLCHFANHDIATRHYEHRLLRTLVDNYLCD